MKSIRSRTVHLVGAQETNHPWAFEIRLMKAMTRMGIPFISTDYRKQHSGIRRYLAQEADLVLVCKGESIPAEVIDSLPFTTALWYAEQIGTKDRFDDLALKRRAELEVNLRAFDYTFSHDQGSLPLFREMNARNPHWLSCAAVDPDVNHKCSCPKEFDLVFIGSKTPRRLKILEFLSSKGYRVYSPNVWDPVQMNEIFNKSRIVLNIHLSDLPNTETRIAEVLGAGSFLLSEKISSPDLLEDGAHYASWTSSDLYGLTERIDFYLANDSERERIAAIGYHHFHQNHTVEKRLQQLFKHIDFDTHKKIWPSYGLGIPFSTDGKPTLRVDAFYEAVSKSLKDKRIVNVQGSYKRCTRKSDVARDPIITSR